MKTQIVIAALLGMTSVFADSVQDKAFDFLYKLATGTYGKKVMAGRTSRGETVSLEAVAGGSYFLKVQGDGTRRIVVTP